MASKQRDTVNTSRSRGSLSQRRVFWLGVLSIVVAVTALNSSHGLYVESKANDGSLDNIVFGIDVSAAVVAAFGCIAIVVCHWCPDDKPPRFRLFDKPGTTDHSPAHPPFQALSIHG